MSNLSKGFSTNRVSQRGRGWLTAGPAAFAAAVLCVWLAACGGSEHGGNPIGGNPDAGNPDGGTGLLACPALDGSELVHTTDITQNETWAGGARVHRVNFGIAVRQATLTLAPCAVVKVGTELALTLVGAPGQPAKLVSQGTADQPVVITSAVSGQHWGQLRGLTTDTSFDLSYTTLDTGGEHTYHGSTLQVRGPIDATAVTPVLRADHLSITGSKGIGLVMEGGAAFTADSTQVSVTNSGNSTDNAAIEISPMPAGTLPPLVVSGNNRDQVRVTSAPFTISRNLTLKKRGAPYHFFFSRLTVVGPSVPTLTIEPGVELRFDDYVRVGDYNPPISVLPAKLIAVGTPAEPIVFTSSKPQRAAGDWPGILLLNAAGSRLENVRIEYAGGFSGVVSANCRPNGSSDNAGLLLSWSGFPSPYIPSASDFSNVVIADSASHGINAMWTSGSFGPDLTAGFTFQNLRGCRQTRNGRTGGCGSQAGCLVP